LLVFLILTAYLFEGSSVSCFEVVHHEELPEGATAVLWAWVRSLGPTPRFRRLAWREFQRALDPLANPKALPRQGRVIKPPGRA